MPGSAALAVPGALAVWPRALARLLKPSRRWRKLQLFLAYLVCELFCHWRFRRRLARLLVRRCGYRRGTLDDLRWLLRAIEQPLCPLTLNKASMQRYLMEEPEAPGARPELRWDHYYAGVREAFCMASPSGQEHELLKSISAGLCRREGLPPPPEGAPAPETEAPIAFGCCPVQAVYKPLPLELAFAAVRKAADAAFTLLGYRQRWMMTPEGWLRYWVARPGGARDARKPILFVHGVGLGAAPYLPFLQRLRRWGPLAAVELPNCSRSHFQAMMPTAASFREAVERLLREEFGITEAGGYVLMGHSLGTDFCTLLLNDPRIMHGEPPGEPALRPARCVLLDPICFAHEMAEAHRLPFWTVREALKSYGKFHWWPTTLFVLLLVVRDEYNQEATKRAIGPGTDSMFRCSPALLGRCPTLVCLSGNDAALPAWKIHDYLRAHYPQIEVRMDPGLEHGGFLMSPLVPTWIARAHAEDILQFLGDSPQLARVASDPASPAGDGGLPLRQRSRSELALGGRGKGRG